jgi:hypothetical protein
MTERGADQSLAIGGNGLLAGPKLPTALPGGKQWQRGMIPGVIANRVTESRHILDDLSVFSSRLADHEKRCARLVPLKDIEQARRVLLVWSVIERKRSHWIASGNLHNGPRCSLAQCREPPTHNAQ